MISVKEGYVIDDHPHTAVGNFRKLRIDVVRPARDPFIPAVVLDEKRNIIGLVMCKTEGGKWGLKGKDGDSPYIEVKGTSETLIVVPTKDLLPGEDGPLSIGRFLEIQKEGLKHAEGVARLIPPYQLSDELADYLQQHYAEQETAPAIRSIAVGRGRRAAR
jgi:hypothetical protein